MNMNAIIVDLVTVGICVQTTRSKIIFEGGRNCHKSGLGRVAVYNFITDYYINHGMLVVQQWH